NEHARASLGDVQLDESTWEGQLADLLIEAEEARSPEGRARLYLRAARIARRFAPTNLEGFLTKAYEADPKDKQGAAMFEQLMLDEERVQSIVDLQRRILGGLSGTARGAVAFRYGVRWATRHQNADLGGALLEEALEHDPSNEAAFAYLRELWGAKQ